MSGVKASGVGSAFGLLLCFQMAWAAPEIITCIGPNGKPIIGDRQTVECINTNKTVRNKDGSVKATIDRTLTPEERAAEEARLGAEEDARIARANVVKAEQLLRKKFPNEAAHQKGRAADLDEPLKSIKLAESRLATLAVERKVLDDEAEFYKGRQMPAKLKALFDANDASTMAQRDLLQKSRSEVSRINEKFDEELFRLKQLWSGVQPGSTRAYAGVAAAAAAASAPKQAQGVPARRP